MIIANTQKIIFPPKLSVMLLANPISEICQIRAMIKPLMKRLIISPLNPIIYVSSLALIFLVFDILFSIKSESPFEFESPAS